MEEAADGGRWRGRDAMTSHPVTGRDATAWRPSADGRDRVRQLARHIDDLIANGRDAVAPLPMTGGSGKRLAVSGWERQKAKGRPETG